MKTIVSIIIAVMFLALNSITRAATVLTFFGPGYMSLGGVYTYNTSNSNFEYSSNPADLTANYKFSFWTLNYSTVRSVNIRAEHEQPFTLGYHNLSTALPPNFVLTAQGRVSTNNQSGGWYRVLEANISPGGGFISKFAVDFVHIDSAGVLSGGSLRVNSNVELMTTLTAVPEPSSAILLIPTALFLTRRRR